MGMEVIPGQAEAKPINITKMNNTTKSILSLLLIFFSFILSLALPIISPILGMALLLGGIFIYRNNKSPAMRRVAVIAIASGITVILIIIFTLLFLTTIHTTTTVYIENNSILMLPKLQLTLDYWDDGSRVYNGHDAWIRIGSGGTYYPDGPSQVWIKGYGEFSNHLNPSYFWHKLHARFNGYPGRQYAY